MSRCENTSATTESQPTDVAAALFELKDAEGDILWWWHSHVNMQVFFSGTDTATIEEIGQNGACAATVFNKKGEMHSGLYVKTDDLYPNIYTECDTEIGSPTMQSEVDEWDKEYKEKYIIKKVVTNKWQQSPKAAPFGNVARGSVRSISSGGNKVTGLPDGYVSQPWVVIDDEVPDGWYVDVSLMDKDIQDKWKAMFMQNYGHECVHELDLQDFVEETMYMISGFDPDDQKEVLNNVTLS